MIAYLQGKITHKSPALIYVDIGGIAYEAHISLNTFSKLEEIEEVKLITYLHVKEDSQTIYGFFDEAEKQVFKLLISVSGIGPNTARVVLSYMTVKEVQQSILNENVAAFKKVKGVGPKTAKLIILDLKEKIAKLSLGDQLEMPQTQPGIQDEALAALMALGFQKKSVEKQLEKVIVAQPQMNQVEQLIKEVLRQLS